MIKGCYCDILTDSQSRVLWESGWRSNLIVQKCNLLLAALMKQHQGIQGLLYWAIGEGESDWDSIRPNPDLTTSRLHSELFRQPLSEEQLVYLGDSDKPTETPSSRLEITAEFKGEDLTSNGFQPLREFGLFGGDATDEPDSGFMVDYVIHPRIDLHPGMTLSRKLHLTFAAGVVQEEELAGFGADLPVMSIDGIGDEYTGELNRQGIHSLGDLVVLDPLRPVGSIPQIKLREFRAKARMVMRLRVSLTRLTPLTDRSISCFLMESPEDLARAIDSPSVTPEIVRQLQEELAVFQIALDDAQLQSITLGDVIDA